MAVPRVDTQYQQEIKNAGEELKKHISEKKFSAPDLLRLAYASQFTIANSPDGATPKTTQSDTFNNLQAEIAKIKKKNHPTVTFPDFYQLAGVVAVEALDGGPKIEFVPGRKDSSISPDESCLPDVKQSPSDLRGVFAKVGISEHKHIVALCGGLNLDRSQDPNLKFDNSYFVNLYNKKTSSPTGNALLEDTDFCRFVQNYATDKGTFIKDFEEAHKKLTELGLPHSPFIISASEKNTSLWNNIVGPNVGVAVAAVVVIMSVFYLIINKRRAKHSSQQFQ